MPGFELEFYRALFESLDNNSVLMRVDGDGSYRPIWCSSEYAQMMEGTAEECIRHESREVTGSVYEEDKDEVAYLFKNHVTRDGTNSLTIRKQTLKGNEISVNIHYAFVEDQGIQYAYCTYTDVTELVHSQRQTMAMYRELNKELDALSSQSLAALRSNLTKGVVEEVHGTDLYDVDKVGAPISDLMEVRLANMPVASDRETYLKVFDLEELQRKYFMGEGPASLVIFSRRQSGRQCFIKYSASMRKDPVTGDVIVLGVETEYNSQKVTEVLNEKVLARQYDMVCYIVDANYGVSIGDAANIRRGSIFPKKRDGIYMDYITEQVIPVVPEPSHRPRLNKNRIYVPGAAKHQRYFDRMIRPTLNGLFISTPCKISTDIYIPTPKSFTFVQRVLAEMKILRPWVNCGDVDNFEKALYDQIQPNEHRGHVGIMANDSLIIDADTHKYYSQTPRYEVKISYMGKMPPELKKILRIRDF